MPAAADPTLDEGVVSPALLAAVKARDEGAARELVELLYPLVAAVVQRNLPRRDAPEDLMQDVFLKLFSRLDQYRGEVAFEHWVRRVAWTTCLDRLRRQRARPELRWADLSEEQQAMLEDCAAEEPPAEIASRSAAELLEQLFAQLAPADAWLLRQVELLERSVGEVAEEAGWNAGLARVRLFRARRRLQQALVTLEGKR